MAPNTDLKTCGGIYLPSKYTQYTVLCICLHIALTFYSSRSVAIYSDMMAITKMLICETKEYGKAQETTKNSEYYQQWSTRKKFIYILSHYLPYFMEKKEDNIYRYVRCITNHLINNLFLLNTLILTYICMPTVGLNGDE